LYPYKPTKLWNRCWMILKVKMRFGKWQYVSRCILAQNK
jgi:hypothetical protein